MPFRDAINEVEAKLSSGSGGIDGPLSIKQHSISSAMVRASDIREVIGGINARAQKSFAPDCSEWDRQV